MTTQQRPRTRNLSRDLAIGRALSERKTYRAIATEHGISYQRVDQIARRLLGDICLTAKHPGPSPELRQAIRRRPTMFRRVLEHYERQVSHG